MTGPLRSLLVGYEGSERGDDAIALARALLTVADAEATVVVATVHDGEQPPAATVDRARARWPQLDRSAFRLRRAPSPADGLHELAVELDADAIVVGASHRHGVGRVWPGSATERTLHGAPCAVAVAPPGYAAVGGDGRRLARIAVAFDGSESSARGLDQAVALAQRDGATVVLVNVVDVGIAPPLAFDLNTYLRERHGDARAVLARGAESVAARAAVEQRQIEGQPAPALVELSADFDLMAIGSRSRGAIRRTLLGEVTAQLVRRAACPVLVVPHAPA
ncbi:MAG TPA: universal stress protein [Conexibacter sp.]|nr:universal stress protein [Conexibacter sp.]